MPYGGNLSFTVDLALEDPDASKKNQSFRLLLGTY